MPILLDLTVRIHRVLKVRFGVGPGQNIFRHVLCFYGSCCFQASCEMMTIRCHSFVRDLKAKHAALELLFVS